MRCDKKERASVAGARLFAFRRRALDRQSAVSTKASAFASSLRARPRLPGHDESSIDTPRDLSHPLALRPA
jgi:hypothetical protein